MTVFLRGKRWYFRFMIRGKDYCQSIPEATNEKEAKKVEIRVKSDLLQGKYDLVEGIGEMFFDTLLERFIKYAEANRISWKRSDAHIGKHLSSFFKNKKLNEINPFLIEKYRMKRKEEGRAATTINKEVRLLRRIFNFAIDNEWFNTNPCTSKKVKPFRETNKLERFLTPAEEDRLLAACYGEIGYLKNIILTALNTGARREEILTLKWETVDLIEGTITFLKTKNGRKKTIPISSVLINKLKKLYMTRTSDYVFMNPNTGERVKSIRAAYACACKRANISGLRFHDLRHTAATRMVASGVNLVVVKELLGHADIKSTMIYSHPIDEDKKEAVELLAKYNQQP